MPRPHVAAALRTALCAILVTAVAGCAANGGAATRSLLPAQATHAPAAPSPVRHVVIMIQENRTFDNFFSTYPGAEGTKTGTLSDGQVIALVKKQLAGPSPAHDYADYVRDYDGGKMDGFDLAKTSGGHIGRYPYTYVDPHEIAPYWSLAKQYVLADHMFQTQGSGSFTAHQDLIAGASRIGPNASVIDNPYDPNALFPGQWGCDAHKGTVTSLIKNDGTFLRNGGPFPCFDYPTLRDRLDAKGLSWKEYVPPTCCNGGQMWNAFDAIRAVRYDEKEWETSHGGCPQSNISCPQTNVLLDAKNGTLPAVSWVIPDALDSDHGELGDTGPSWVSAVVNAIGTGPQWNSTVVVVVWDDWGGYYDHVPPPQLGAASLGFRVPCLIVSPYARHGYVSHTQYEFGSILRFVEETFGLRPLGTTDVRAASIGDALNLAMPPRHFKPIRAPHPAAYFLRRPPSNRPLDEE